LRNACGFPRHCVECSLQERAQRIRRWREAGTPEVGFFYAIAGALWLDSTPVPEARQLREVIIPFGSLRSFWNNLRRMMLALAGLPHTSYTRGRVVCVNRLARYHLEVGPELVTAEAMIHQVMEAMHLPTLQTDVRLGPHFQTRGVLMHGRTAPTEVQLATPVRIQWFP
jgi:hypothetical protein